MTSPESEVHFVCLVFLSLTALFGAARRRLCGGAPQARVALLQGRVFFSLAALFRPLSGRAAARGRRDAPGRLAPWWVYSL